ncbi:hypothetical protein PHET_09787 [Paragonimus heterotremus]|uniref:Uncharacterized protein n=1 Tax=Paragonimus heterotremus TaxID=100268 RepID=A0A8J4SGP2_9TREM|nr:hypothetical protein PHET_09787 [Paragonimus heterotremus]
MMWYALILCDLLVIKGELTQKEKEKTLCFHDTLLQMTSNCRSTVKRKVNTLKWNNTLQHFARVYVQRTYFEDVNIPELHKFHIEANIISTEYKVDKYEG